MDKVINFFNNNWQNVCLLEENDCEFIYKVRRISNTLYDEFAVIKSITVSRDDVLSSYLYAIEVAQKLKASSNIISIDDYEVLHSKNKDIINVRGEELISLVRYYSDNKISAREILRLGLDICNSLIDAEKFNINGLYIGINNVYVSKFGTYKLDVVNAYNGRYNSNILLANLLRTLFDNSNSDFQKIINLLLNKTTPLTEIAIMLDKLSKNIPDDIVDFDDDLFEGISLNKSHDDNDKTIPLVTSEVNVQNVDFAGEPEQLEEVVEDFEKTVVINKKDFNIHNSDNSSNMMCDKLNLEDESQFDKTTFISKRKNSNNLDFNKTTIIKNSSSAVRDLNKTVIIKRKQNIDSNKTVTITSNKKYNSSFDD